MNTKQKIHFLALCCLDDSENSSTFEDFAKSLKELYRDDKATFDDMFTSYKEDAFSSLFPEYRNYFYIALEK